MKILQFGLPDSGVFKISHLCFNNGSGGAILDWSAREELNELILLDRLPPIIIEKNGPWLTVSRVTANNCDGLF